MTECEDYTYTHVPDTARSSQTSRTDSRSCSTRVDIDEWTPELSALLRDVQRKNGFEREPELSTWQRDAIAFKVIILSWMNVLLIFAPIGWISKSMEWNSAIIFSTNFMAIIPLAAVLGAATEALAEHTGQTLGGLINASFGNAVELIITVDAIKKDLCKVVQGGLVGSVLSNLLLVLGMSFFSSALVRHEQTFNKDGAGANTSCLLVASIGLVIPTLFAQESTEEKVLFISRICAVIMICMYGAFLFFQLFTHQSYFDDADDNTHLDAATSLALAAQKEKQETGTVSALTKVSMVVVGDGQSNDDEPEQQLSAIASVVLLCVATLIISVLSESMVDSIQDFAKEWGVPMSFIGLILLPIVGNAAEHTTAVVAAFKGKMDLAIGVAVGSSSQIALLVVPVSIIIGWVSDKDMNLNFGTFYSGAFILTVFLVGSVLQDGSSNWLEGVMLVMTYVLIATISWNQVYEA